MAGIGGTYKTEIESELNKILSDLRSKDPNVCLKAIENLKTDEYKEYKDRDEIVHQLNILLSHQEERIRSATAAVLVTSERGRATLADEIKSTKNDTYIKNWIAGIRSVPTEESVTFLTGISNKSLQMKKPLDLAIAQYSVEAIGIIGHSEVNEELRTYTTSQLVKLLNNALKSNQLEIAANATAQLRRIWEVDYSAVKKTFETAEGADAIKECFEKLKSSIESYPPLFGSKENESKFDAPTRMIYERLALLFYYGTLHNINTKDNTLEIILPDKDEKCFKLVSIEMNKGGRLGIKETTVKTMPTKTKEIPEIVEFNVPEQLHNLTLLTMDKLNNIKGTERPSAMKGISDVVASGVESIQSQGMRLEVVAGKFNIDESREEIKATLKAILRDAVKESDVEVARNAAYAMRLLGPDEILKKTIEDMGLDIEIRRQALDSFVSALRTANKPVADYLVEMYVKMPTMRKDVIDYLVEVGRARHTDVEKTDAGKAIDHISAIINDELVVGGREFTEKDPEMKKGLVEALWRIRNRPAIDALVRLVITQEYEISETARYYLDTLYRASGIADRIASGESPSALLKDKSETVKAAAMITPAVVKFMESLKPEEINERVAALELLSGREGAKGYIGDSRARTVLLRALNDEEDVIRAAAAKALGAIVKKGDNTAIIALLELTGDDSSTVRASALQSLGVIASDNETVVEKATTLLTEDESPLVRKAAIGVLRSSLTSDRRALIEKALDDADVGVRIAAAQALKLSDMLADIALKEQRSGDRINALRALSAIDMRKEEGASIAQRLYPALKDKNWEVRKAAVETIGQLGVPVEEGVVNALKDENANVRATALEVLSSYTYTSTTKNMQNVVKELATVVQDAKETTHLRLRAIDVLYGAVVNEETLIAVFKPLINDTDLRVAAAAINKISTLRNRREILDDILARAEDPKIRRSSEMREALKGALDKIDKDLAEAGAIKKIFTKVKSQREKIAQALKVIEQ